MRKNLLQHTEKDSETFLSPRCGFPILSFHLNIPVYVCLMIEFLYSVSF